jgi:uncharacterized membrane protein
MNVREYADRVWNRVVDTPVAVWLTEVCPERNDPTWYVLGFSLALFVGFSLYTSLRYATYHMTGSDFGSYVHMFATTLSGKGWLLQGKYIVSHPNKSYWGGHFSLTLLSFLPIYALFSSSYTLLVLKSFLLAVSVPVLWFLARDRLESDRLALLVTISYAVNPFLWSAWLFDFQEQILLPIFIFAAYYAYANRRRIAFLVFVTLTVFTNEFVTILVGGFLVGLAITAYRDDRFRNELPTLGGAAAITLLARVVAGYVISQYSTLSGIPPVSIAPPLRPFTETARVSIGELLGIILTHPTLLFETLSVDIFRKVVFLSALLMPVLFLSLRDEATVGALAPYLGFSWIFTGREVYYTFDAHYPLYLLPFIYIGAVRVLGRLECQYSSPKGPLTSLHNDVSRHTLPGIHQLLVVAVIFSAVGGGAVVASVKQPLDIPGERTELREEAFDMVPVNASLLTTNGLFPHVATRENATYTPVQNNFRRYVDRYGLPMPEYILYDVTLDGTNLIRETYRGQLGSTYGLYAYQDGIWIWKRGYNGPPTGITREELSLLQHNLDAYLVNSGRLVNGKIVASSVPRGENIWYGPYIVLPPGKYTVTFVVNVSHAQTYANGTPTIRLDVAGGRYQHIIEQEFVTETNGFERVTLTFTLHEIRRKIEFRGFSNSAGGKVVLKKVVIRYQTGVGNSSMARSDRIPVHPHTVTTNALQRSLPQSAPSRLNILSTMN